MTKTVRMGSAAAVLMLVLAAYLSYHPASTRLLTPMPGRSFPIIFLLGAIIGIGCAMTILGDVPSRLVRRLGTILIMALSLYMLGEAARGYYAAGAFSMPDQITRDQSRWMVTGSGSGTVTAVREPSAGRALDFAADPSVDAVVRPGICFTTEIERSAEGVERLLASPPLLSAADFSSC